MPADHHFICRTFCDQLKVCQFRDSCFTIAYASFRDSSMPLWTRSVLGKTSVGLGRIATGKYAHIPLPCPPTWTAPSSASPWSRCVANQNVPFGIVKPRTCDKSFTKSLEVLHKGITMRSWKGWKQQCYNFVLYCIWNEARLVCCVWGPCLKRHRLVLC